jgi:mono/diheme cytochrome c family protein
VLYEATCGACHQPHGLGQEGLAPPLADSEWVADKNAVLTRIALHGVRGPISVQGRKWDLDMPSFNSLDDEQLAAVLTYIRREWDHPYDPIDPAEVAKIRKATVDRAEAWTESELKAVK